MLVEIVPFLKTMALPAERGTGALFTSSSCSLYLTIQPYIHTYLTFIRAPTTYLLRPHNSTYHRTYPRSSEG